MRVIVCGGRDYADTAFFDDMMFRLHLEHGFTVVVHGAAPGADTLAKLWAEKNSIIQEPHPANWKTYGNGAGPIRNREMAKLGARLCIAFPGGRGTDNMVRTANSFQIPVIRPKKTAREK